MHKIFHRTEFVWAFWHIFQDTVNGLTNTQAPGDIEIRVYVWERGKESRSVYKRHEHAHNL